MGLFENHYKAAAVTELERATRELEERNKKAQTIQEVKDTAQSLNSNISFAEQIRLISAQQAEIYRDRVRRAEIEYYRLQRTEHQEMVDGFENPRERSERFMKMEDAEAEIARNRAERTSESSEEQRATPAPVKSTPEPELER